jgi:pyruvate-ferredoxin/flavodoxin oxidoreductase
MAMGMTHQKMAVETGYFPLYRYDPRLAAEGKNPLKLDSKAPKGSVEDFMYMENRFKMLTKSNPKEAKELADLAQKDVAERWKAYEELAADGGTQKPAPAPAAPSK